MKNELVSIILPIKNNLEFIKSSINSILYQSYKNIEIIIIDDSIENNELIGPFLRDNRIRYYKGNNKGISNALNIGINKTNGTIIARMDGDDIMHKDRIDNQINFLKGNKLNANIVGSNAIYINKRGKILYERRLPEYHSDIEFYMPIFTSLLHPTLMTYKSILQEVGGYNEDYLFAEDLELYLRLLTKGYIFSNIQSPLLYYRFKKNVNKINNENYYLGYDLGKKYLYSKKEKDELFDLRLGLLEYYKGNMKRARKHFYLCKEANPIAMKKYKRYLIISFIPSFMVNFLRTLYIPQFINIYLAKIFKIEMQFKTKNNIN